MNEPDSWLGQLIDGRYRILGLIGRGGMGRVYDAEHLGLSRRVAIKLLDAGNMPAAADPRRFAREAFAAGRLAHPNCVGVTDFGALPDGTLFLAMEKLAGRSIEEVVRAEGRLPVGRALHVMRHLLRGLEHAHQLGIVHRDLTPRNIFLIDHLGDRDFAKILDFGLAKLHGHAAEAEGRGKLTQTGIVCGTPRYIAPEQALGDDVDHRADLYAASAILYEMITGRPPFLCDDLRGLLLMHIGGNVPRMHEVLPGVDVPVDVEMLVRRGLAKRPEDRPATAAEYGAAIDSAPVATDSGPWMTITTEQILTAQAPAQAGDSSPSGQLVAPDSGTGSLPLPAPGRRRRAMLAVGAASGLALIAVIAGTWPAPPDAAVPVRTVAAAGAGNATDPLANPPPSPPPSGGRVSEGGALRNHELSDERLLKRLRSERPRDAAVHRALADLYAARPWPTEAVKAYRAAVRLDPAQRADPALHDRLIDQLGSRSAGGAAARLLEEIGAPALPRLEAAARSHPRQAIRARAARTLAAVRASLG